MVRHERHELLLHADRPHPRPAAAVRDAKRLVQVKVADVGADEPRRGEPDLRVHVRAVHVHLAAVLVDGVADVLDAVLVHAVRGRVRHHERREVILVLLRRRLELRDVDVTRLVRADDDNLVAHHRRGRGVRAVRAHGDDAHVPVVIAAGLVVRADRHEAGVLAARAAVGLQRHPVEAGDFDELLRERVEQLLVPLRLLLRRERVDVRELWPRHGHHLRRRVELHRARPQRDHRVHER
mmetsp:Transcript_10399/g.37637  ORF Transcript_10399/g.37637 Transcript_10399/m.37637 type:complete len:238 (+) Transcript_10399:911-1624(+)